MSWLWGCGVQLHHECDRCTWRLFPNEPHSGVHKSTHPRFSYYGHCSNLNILSMNVLQETFNKTIHHARPISPSHSTDGWKTRLHSCEGEKENFENTMWQVALPAIRFQSQQFSTEWWWRVTSLLVPHSWRWKLQRPQLECVCTQQERASKTAMLNALGIDRAIHVAAKWTLMYYKVPVGAAQTKLFSLLPIHQESIIYWGEEKKNLDF